jgi:hypothetical protein
MKGGNIRRQIVLTSFRGECFTVPIAESAVNLVRCTSLLPGQQKNEAQIVRVTAEPTQQAVRKDIPKPFEPTL